MTRPITSFSGDHAFLSNFFDAPVAFQWDRLPVLEPIIYATAEHAYQAAKATNRVEHDKVMLAKTPGGAKRAGRHIDIWGDWDAVRVEVMTAIIASKFAVGSELAEKLVATGDAQLVEGNYWGDTFWGVYNGNGSNILGNILMARRNELNSALRLLATVQTPPVETVDWRAAYEEAMGESNAAGFVGVTPAQTIKILAEASRRTCLDCEGSGERMYPVDTHLGPDAREELAPCSTCAGSGSVSAVIAEVPDNKEFNDIVRRVFMANGFTIKEGQDDLKSYVFAAARALVDELTGVAKVKA